MSRLANGVTVVSQNQGEGVGTVSVYVAAGSRNETAKTAGVSHFLKFLPFQSTVGRTNMYIAREAENHGYQLLSCANRENLGYHVHFLPNQLGTAAGSLVDTVVAPAFFDWETRDNTENIHNDLDAVKGDNQLSLIKDAHKGLFRDTLGRPLLCSSARAEDITADLVKDYYKAHFVGERIAVVGTGVSHAQLVEAVKGLEKLPAKGAATKAAKYYGGAEIRTDLATDKVHAAFAFPGAAVGGADAAAVGVLRFLLGGSGANLKGSNGSFSNPLSAALAAAAPGSFCVQALHSSYSDAGLLAVTLSTDASTAAARISAAASTIQSVLSSVSDEDVARAKNQLIFSILSQERGALVSAAGAEALATHTFTPAAAKAAAVEKVTVADVKAAATRIKATKPVYVVRGALDETPYLDQLFK